MASIKLYYFPDSSSIAPHILLHEAGVQFETIQVDTSMHNLVKVNPKKRVPVLIVDGQVITESSAIMTAIAQLVPERQMLGKNGLETVRVYEWINWLSGTLHGHAWGMILRPERYCDNIHMHSNIRTKGLEVAKEIYNEIEQKISGTNIVGDHFIVVDPFMYVFFRWAASKGLITMETHPKLCRSMSALAEKASVKKALEVEGIARIEL